MTIRQLGIAAGFDAATISVAARTKAVIAAGRRVAGGQRPLSLSGFGGGTGEQQPGRGGCGVAQISSLRRRNSGRGMHVGAVSDSGSVSIIGEAGLRCLQQHLPELRVAYPMMG